MVATLKINQVRCVHPSTGVAGYAEGFIEIVSTTMGAALATLIFGVTGPGAVAAGLAGAAGGAVLGKGINEASKMIGQTIHDDLYILVNGKKIWPDGDYQAINSGETVDVNYSTQFDGQITVTLMEHDTISYDDNLGEAVLDQNSQSDVYMFTNSEEGDVYSVSIEIL